MEITSIFVLDSKKSECSYLKRYESIFQNPKSPGPGSHNIKSSLRSFRKIIEISTKIQTQIAINYILDQMIETQCYKLQKIAQNQHAIMKSYDIDMKKMPLPRFM